MNIFERASRGKLRFQLGKGQASTEDLWDLSLESLDKLAISINKTLKEQSQESFLSNKKNNASDLVQLKLDIVKHVITSKEAANQAAQTRIANEKQRARIREILGQKEDEALMNKSPEELQKMLEEV